MEDAARDVGLDEQQRRELGRYIEQGSRKCGENFSYNDIVDAAERIKGGERLIQYQMTTRITVAQLNELLTSFQPMRCWRFGRYLGAMLTLDFGDQIDFETHDSTTVAEGGLMMGVRNFLWVAIDGERTITTAEDVDDVVLANDLERRPIGAALQVVESTADRRWTVFRFDNCFALKVDAANTWKTESDIFEITLPDGRIVVLDEQGAIEVLDEIESIRAERWRLRLM